MRRADIHQPAYRRRAAMYFMVLMVGTLIGTVALASLSMARMGGRISALSGKMSMARQFARSAIAAAEQEMATVSTWRTTYTHNVWSTERAIGDGKVQWKFADELNASLTADPFAAIRVYGRGTVDDVVRTYSVLVKPEPTPTNLLDNPGFEQGTLYWTATGSCTMSTWTTVPNSGTYCVLVQNRLLAADGPSQLVTGKIANGSTFNAEAWARSYGISLSMKLVLTVTSTGSGTQRLAGNSTLCGTSWTKISATFTPTWTGTLTEARLSVESNSLLGSFIVDDVRLTAQPSAVPYRRVPGSFRQEIGP
ncbi:MAG: carbohydrate binding domain-containing protein [Phycisphaerae bacterium]|nr:carbohydrate binding domain-containing protein [Phycisphaerae bacterium]